MKRLLNVNSTPLRWRSWFKSGIQVLLVSTLGALSVIYAGLYLFQERMLFHPQPIAPSTLEWARKNWPEAETSLMSSDQVLLHGWWLRSEREAPEAPLLIYFGGNAEEVTDFLSFYPELPKDWSLLALNYRGYGLSEGSPGQAAFFRDALSLYDHYAPGGNGKVVAMGRSLGTGVAVYLARQRPLAGVILISPYDSIRALARDIYPYVPVGWLLRHPFDSLAQAPAIQLPALMLVGARDGIVPPDHSRHLFRAWGGEKHWMEFPDAGHGNIIHAAEFWRAIRQFLARLDDPTIQLD